MNLLKIIFILLAVGAGVWLLFWLVGFLSAILWYLLWVGLIAVGGFIGYKFLIGKADETPQLDEKKPTAISEMQDFDRALEDYKAKSLRK